MSARICILNDVMTINIPTDSKEHNSLYYSSKYVTRGNLGYQALGSFLSLRDETRV